jgi:uncharacterized membrane protein
MHYKHTTDTPQLRHRKDTMQKHRIELFSDGVFAIVLTLLVLELKLPKQDGLEGLREITPELLVHVVAFFLVGASWISHFRLMAAMRLVTSSTLVWNLVALFWTTLLPFGARLATEHPDKPLGAAVMCGCASAYIFSLVAMRPYRPLEGETPSPTATLGLLCAALSWISPWCGYLLLPLIILVNLFQKPVSIELAHLRALDEANEAANNVAANNETQIPPARVSDEMVFVHPNPQFGVGSEFRASELRASDLITSLEKG